MVLSVVIMAGILILTHVIKRKWQAITGLVLDLIILALTIPDVLNLFNTPETESGAEALGYAIGLSMFGPMILILLIAMIGIGIAQAATLKKYSNTVNKQVTIPSQKIMVTYIDPNGANGIQTFLNPEAYQNFINNFVPRGYKILHVYNVVE